MLMKNLKNINMKEKDFVEIVANLEIAIREMAKDISHLKEIIMVLKAEVDTLNCYQLSEALQDGHFLT